MHYLPEDPDWSFAQLMELAPLGAADELFADCLHHAEDVFGSLYSFVISQPNDPRLAILLDLLGKLGDQRAAGLLTRFLDVNVPELRAQAATSLGWLRARVALEKLDTLEGTDPEERVRAEARIAIEEILLDFPGFRSRLHNHRRTRPRTAGTRRARGGPRPIPSKERQRLVAALPSLLATKHRVLPLRLLPNGSLHIAVRGDRDENLAEVLKSLTGHEVTLEIWELPQILQGIERFYCHGYDDFVDLIDQLTPAARAELVELILQRIEPAEPHAPLDEAVDAVEAVQNFLGVSIQQGHHEVTLTWGGESFEINLVGREGTPRQVPPPPPAVRVRFANVLKMLFGFASAPSEPAREATIRCADWEKPFTLVANCDFREGRETLRIEFRDPARN